MPSTIHHARPRRPTKRDARPRHPTSPTASPSPADSRCVDFDVRKHRILTDLANNTNDLSPKGSVDAPIASLVRRINAAADLYTTSSCSGRVALFEHRSGDGRGKGGRWLLCEHGAITLAQLHTALHTAAASTAPTAAVLRFEPFILSIACRSLAAALALLSAALQSGCRESGIVSCQLPARPAMVSVRCSIRMELPVLSGSAAGLGGLGDGYVDALLVRLNEKMADNMAKIASFERWFETVCEGGGGSGLSGKAAGLEERKEAEYSDEEVEGDEEWDGRRQRMKQSKQGQQEQLEDDSTQPASSYEHDSSQHATHHTFPSTLTLSHSPPSQLSARHTRLLASITSLEARLDHLSSKLPPSAAIPSTSLPPATASASTDADDRCWCLLTPRQHAKAVRSACKALDWNDTHRKVTPAPPHLIATLLRLSATPPQTPLPELDGWMALPVNGRGERECRRWLDGEGGLGGLCGVLQLDRVPLLLHWAVSPSLLPPLSPNQRLQQSLRTFLQQLNLPASSVSSLLSSVPHKWEQLGDLVLLPADAFTSPACSSTLASLPPAALGRFHAVLLSAFRCQRLARQQPVSVGLKRSSAVQLLVGQDGWVEHRENGVLFQFDVTRSMFASGNGSEKARLIELVKKADAQRAASGQIGEVVLDLYAGIGYFSLPLLVHTSVSHIHLCEHNEHTFDALTRSLATNHIPPTRYTLYPGDNRSPHLTTRLTHTADRVLLGLLPSSEDGWPLAVRALRPGGSGGWLHVHGNVRVGREADWVAGVVAGLEGLLRLEEAGCVKRSWVVRVVHVEHVKNFAPLVKHVVADVHLGPPTGGSGTDAPSGVAAVTSAAIGDMASRHVYRTDGIASYDNPSPSLFWSTIYPAARPAVLHSLPLGNLAAFTPAALLALPPSSAPAVSIHVCPESSGRMDFVHKNYTHRTVPFHRFMHAVVRDASVRDDYYVSPHERYYLRSLGSDPRREVADLWRSFPVLADQFRVPDVLEGKGLFSSVLRISSAGLSLWTHFDNVPNLLCHLHGVKRVTLFPPSASLALRLPPQPHASSSPFLDLYTPAPAPTAAAQHVSDPAWQRLGRQVVLRPGDVLFIPPLWFHHVETLAAGADSEAASEATSAVGVSVNVFWRALDGALYTGGDVYGNRDLVAGVECMRRAEEAVKQVVELPAVYRDFYLDRAVSVLQAAKTSSTGDEWDG